MALRKRTLDILDAHISLVSSEYLGYDEYSRGRVFSEVFRLDDVNWQRYYDNFNKVITSNSINVLWDEFKYVDVLAKNDLIDQKITTEETGIYLFVVKSPSLINDHSKFVLYVGISGENGKKRPLKHRLQDYFRLSSIKKRDAIIRILEKYRNNVYVSYFLTDADFNVLKELETALIGFFYPLANKDDFPVEVKPSKKSF